MRSQPDVHHVHGARARRPLPEDETGLEGAPPGMMWHHCWIPRPDHGDGRPTVHLTGTVQAQAEALGITHWHLSLSHDGDVATAYVVAERRAAEEESA